MILRGFVEGLLLVWPLWVALGGLVGAAIAYGIAARIVRRRRLARSGIANIDRFGGEMFEQYLELLFERLGYAVERTRFAGDYGGDLVLRKDGVRTVVQAKRYNKPVGVRAIQEAVAAKGYYGCTEAMVVSNAHYTKQAAHLARTNHVVLWDRDALIRQLAAMDAGERVREATTPVSVTKPSSVIVAQADPALPRVESCEVCAKGLTAGERQYCERNAKRFGGRLLCFRHQRMKRA